MSILSVLGLKKDIDFDQLMGKATGLQEEYNLYIEQAEANIQTLEESKQKIEQEIKVRNDNIERSKRISGRLGEFFS